MTLPSLRLKANAERRLRAGHLWSTATKWTSPPPR